METITQPQVGAVPESIRLVSVQRPTARFTPPSSRPASPPLPLDTSRGWTPASSRPASPPLPHSASRSSSFGPQVVDTPASSRPASPHRPQFSSRSSSLGPSRSPSRPPSSHGSQLPSSPSSTAHLNLDVESSHIHSSELAPADGGYRAWTVLAASFLLEFACLGPAFSFSVFQDYLVHSTESPLRRSTQDASNVSISAIGTVLTSLIYLAPPVLQGPWTRFAEWNRWMGAGCILMSAASLFIASFANSVELLIIFMGVLPGLMLGLSLINYTIWLPQWFIQKRGLANGLAFSGAGTGGLLFPFLFNSTLRSLGFHWTLRVWAICLVTVGLLACWLVRPRLPLRKRNAAYTRPRRARSWKDMFAGLRYLSTPLWISGALSTFAASIAFFSVSFYLATYCTSLGLTPTAATAAVAAFNGASLLGEISIGSACDRFSYPLIMGAIGVVGCLSTLLLFGLAQSLTGVLFFTLLYGWAVGSWCATWTPSALDVARLRGMQTATVILSYTFVRGLASLVGPLIAASLYKPEDNLHKAIFGSFGFDSLIAFVGACTGAVSIFAACLQIARTRSFRGTDLSLLQERF